MMSAAPRVVVVAGLPSRGRAALCVVGAAGAMSLIFAVAFAVSVPASPLLAVVLTVAMLIFWSPVTCWSAWWLSVPAVLIVGVALACLTHRYRLPGQRSRWRRISRVCAAAVLLNGGWTLLVGVILLVSAFFV